MTSASGGKRPRVGVSTSRGVVQIGEEPLWSTYSPVPYEEAVLAAGGLPLNLPWVEEGLVGELCAELDAVILTGGGDVCPELYDEVPEPETSSQDAVRDHLEMALARHALATAMPVLGICRGAQLLNVALGGSLHQHLADVVGSTDHRPFSVPDEQTTHAVDVDLSSRLAAILRAERLQVNSTHHQAVADLGNGLRVAARAEDGVIEAIEHEDASRFVVAVQWHPEALAASDAVQRRLFAALVDAAREFREQRLGSSADADRHIERV
jgi:putative glutamine amidotransferase